MMSAEIRRYDDFKYTAEVKMRERESIGWKEVGRGGGITGISRRREGLRRTK